MLIETASDRKLKAVERKILKEPLLKLQGLDDLRDRKPLQGLKFIINQQFDRASINTLTNSLQCSKNRRRSQGDLYLLMKYYYPDITFKEVRSLLIQLINDSELNTSYCLTINKRVFWKWSKRCRRGENCCSRTDCFDEYNLTFS